MILNNNDIYNHYIFLLHYLHDVTVLLPSREAPYMSAQMFQHNCCHMCLMYIVSMFQQSA